MPYSIAFCGTPNFAVPALESLIEDSDFNIELVLTQPDRPSGRGKKLKPSPVKVFAQEHSLEVITPEKVSEESILNLIKEKKLDAAVVVAYGQILPQTFLDSFQKGCVNIHSSLLPRWRGAAPMQRALMEGDEVTGVSLQKIVKKLDAGDIIGERVFPLTQEMGAKELYDQLSHLGAELIVNEFKQFLEDKIDLKVQDESQVTYAKKIMKEEGLIDWSLSALQIHNKIRGLNMGGPFGYSQFREKQIKLHSSRPYEEDHSSQPGDVVEVRKDSFFVACGEGLLELYQVQPESKAKMLAGDFIRGYHLQKGDRFGE